VIKKSELAIGAGGVNMIERLYFNLPSFIICVADNQKNATEYLKNQNSIIHLGESRNVSSKKISDNLENLIKHKKRFEILQKNTLKVSLNLNSSNPIIKKLNSVLIK
jgi:spore coat polysaccharide biosynthesis predicted glycosyltransferase SpsG